MAKKFLTWLLLFVGISLILQSFQQGDTPVEITDDLVLTASDDSYNVGTAPQITVKNFLSQDLRIDSDCPSEPLLVEKQSNGAWNAQVSEEGLYISCQDLEDSSSALESVYSNTLVIPANGETIIDYSPWKKDLFSEEGKYRVSLLVELKDEERSYSTEFEIQERGIFSSIGFHFFYRPIYNVMLYLTSIIPDHNFGIAIIILTILIRLVLLVPNQRALSSQRSMMKIQPELDAIKTKYKGNQEKISQETMLLWKKHSVNPIGGCLPLLIQMPILISLFYVVKTGFTPYQGHILYSFLEGFDLSLVSTNFYGILNLQEVNILWLPFLVGFLQFIQLKLSFARRSKQQKHGKEIIDVGDKKDSKEKEPQNPMQMMSKSMMYFMPVMMALMAASLPSGVGIYLIISTLFGIGQQYFVNRSVG